MNKSQSSMTSLPFTKEQFNQIKEMLEVNIPAQEDNLKRAKASGLNVDDLVTELQKHKTSLQNIVNAWKDKY